VIQIKVNAESTGRRAALLLELERLRNQMKVMQLRMDQIHIVLRDEEYDGDDLFKGPDGK